jgi:DNA-binding response OmpR family regulator
MSQTNPLILVADDEPAMNEMVTRHLRAMTNPKVDVVQASDGAEAWRLARKHLPDLVVLDVMMPEMSGWEVCRKIREDIALAHTGVVILTGIGETLNSLTSPLYEADAYIDKPFQANELHAKVRETLKLRQSAREGVDRPSSTFDLEEILKARPLAKAQRAASASRKKTPTKAKKAAAKKAGVQATKVATKTKAKAKSPKVAVKKVAKKASAGKKAVGKPVKAPAQKKHSAQKSPKKTAKKSAKKSPGRLQASAKKVVSKRAPTVGKRAPKKAAKSPSKKAKRR